MPKFWKQFVGIKRHNCKPLTRKKTNESVKIVNQWKKWKKNGFSFAFFILIYVRRKIGLIGGMWFRVSLRKFDLLFARVRWDSASPLLDRAFTESPLIRLSFPCVHRKFSWSSVHPLRKVSEIYLEMVTYYCEKNWRILEISLELLFSVSP